MQNFSLIQACVPELEHFFVFVQKKEQEKEFF